MPYKDREQMLACKARYRDRNREKLRAASLERNRKIGIERPRYWANVAKAYRRRHPERHIAAVMDWQRRNPEKVKQYEKIGTSRRREIPERWLHHTVSVSFRKLLDGSIKSSRTFDVLDYTPADLKAHLEKQFLPGMSWTNYGEWHIDHIRPLISFVITSISDPQLTQAWALTNLRPLWAKENLSKGAKALFLI